MAHVHSHRIGLGPPIRVLLHLLLLLLLLPTPSSSLPLRHRSTILDTGGPHRPSIGGGPSRRLLSLGRAGGGHAGPSSGGGGGGGGGSSASPGAFQAAAASGLLEPLSGTASAAFGDTYVEVTRDLTFDLLPGDLFFVGPWVAQVLTELAHVTPTRIPLAAPFAGDAVNAAPMFRVRPSEGVSFRLNMSSFRPGSRGAPSSAEHSPSSPGGQPRGHAHITVGSINMTMFTPPGLLRPETAGGAAPAPGTAGVHTPSMSFCMARPKLWNVGEVRGARERESERQSRRESQREGRETASDS